jgi:hypothetical protein
VNTALSAFCPGMTALLSSDPFSQSSSRYPPH